jgi:hypothetical protein
VACSLSPSFDILVLAFCYEGNMLTGLKEVAVSSPGPVQLAWLGEPLYFGLHELKMSGGVCTFPLHVWA